VSICSYLIEKAALILTYWLMQCLKMPSSLIPSSIFWSVTWRLCSSWDSASNMHVRGTNQLRGTKFQKKYNQTDWYLYLVNTHMHSDHVTASGQLKKRLPYCKTVIAASSGALADVLVHHGDMIEFGSHKIEVRATPGHTNGKSDCWYIISE